jgi:hypothetical protein
MTRPLVPGLLAEGITDTSFLAPLIRRQLVALSEKSARCVVSVGAVQLADCHTVEHPDRVLDAAVELAADCHLLFVHHDHRERTRADALIARIEDRLGGAGPRGVRVVPVKETEAWMLADRAALGSIRGAEPDLAELPPAPRDVERVEDPKALLRRVLPGASRRQRVLYDYFDYLGRRVDAAVLVAVPAYAEWVESTTSTLKELRFL